MGVVFFSFFLFSSSILKHGEENITDHFSHMETSPSTGCRLIQNH
jgi:hypothetical protein